MNLHRLHVKYLRPWLPRLDWSRWNGVPVGCHRRAWRLGDKLVPWSTPSTSHQEDRERYKKVNCEALGEVAWPADEAVVLGGGLGVTAVKAARSAGRVHVFEPNPERLGILERTLEVNGVRDRCKVRRAFVGTLSGPEQWRGEAERVEPGDLPACGVLEVDVEGAEQSILEGLSAPLPRAVVVETHPKMGCPTGVVAELLEGHGYEVENRGADPVDGHVLLGKREVER